ASMASRAWRGRGLCTPRSSVGPPVGTSLASDRGPRGRCGSDRRDGRPTIYASGMRIPHWLTALALLAPTFAHAHADVTGPGPFTVAATTITWTRTSSTTGPQRPLASTLRYPANPGTGTADRGVFPDA